jgi:tRNA-Thr(GGU) m(6)t(6)A37 methyltransferase TsaA
VEGLQIIARIRSPFPEKFGIPRQSGLVQEAEARIVFEKPFRIADAVRGLEGFSHIWLLWQFSEAVREGEPFSPTVRPPRLGGNERMGVFATRSPYRPNPIGMSSVRLDGIDYDPELGPVLRVSGADLVDGTPILDIKPYLAYTDSHPDAAGGFTDVTRMELLEVDFPPALLEKIPPEHREGLTGVLRCDPRPRYQNDPERVYGLTYGGRNVKFTVSGGVLTVVAVE